MPPTVNSADSLKRSETSLTYPSSTLEAGQRDALLLSLKARDMRSVLFVNSMVRRWETDVSLYAKTVRVAQPGMDVERPRENDVTVGGIEMMIGEVVDEIETMDGGTIDVMIDEMTADERIDETVAGVIVDEAGIRLMFRMYVDLLLMLLYSCQRMLAGRI